MYKATLTTETNLCWKQYKQRFVEHTQDPQLIASTEHCICLEANFI